MSQYAYDSEGRVTMSRDFYGRVKLSEYDSAGNLIAVTNPLSQVTRMEYDEEQRVIAVLHPDGVAERYSYQEDGRGIQSSTERAGVVISNKQTIQLSSDGLLSQIVKQLEINGKPVLTATTEYGKLGELAKESLQTCTAIETIDLVNAKEGNGLLPLRQNKPVP